MAPLQAHDHIDPANSKPEPDLAQVCTINAAAFVLIALVERLDQIILHDPVDMNNFDIGAIRTSNPNQLQR